MMGALLGADAFGANDFALGPLPAPAVERLATLRVRVSLSEADWTYDLGQPAMFKVRVFADETPLDGVNISYKVGPEFFEGPEQEAVVSAEGLEIDGGTLNVPGFIRCRVWVEYRGETYQGIATAGFAPEKIEATQVEPDDFDAFWAGELEKLSEIPIDAQLTLLPEQCTATVNAYHVSFANKGSRPGRYSRIYGIYCEPRAPGKYPAILMVPGAGVRSYSASTYYAEQGAITLQIGIHGIPVNLSNELYRQLGSGALEGYWNYRLDDRESFYYNRVYLGCVRANDFLVSRENWNGEDLLVTGGSQGGQLTVVTSALDKRVTALAALYPAFSDVTGPLHGRAGGWPAMFQPDDKGHSPVSPAEDMVRTTGYYDTVNFARRITAPGYYGWGYNDVVCCPTSLFAMFNQVTAPKQLHLLLEMGHAHPPEQSAAVKSWIVNRLGL